MSELAVIPNEDHITRIIEQVMPRNASEVDRRALATMMRNHGLDPLRKEVYPVIFGGKLCLFISVDGWRRLARESGRYRGGSAEYHRNADGQVEACTFTAFTTDGGEYKFTCWLSEFRGNSPNWRQQPLHMLRIRAESHCLKAAFGFGGWTEGDEETIGATETAVADPALAALNARIQSGERTTVTLPSAPVPAVEQPPEPDATLQTIEALADQIAARAKAVGIRWTAKQAIKAARGLSMAAADDPIEFDRLVFEALKDQAARLEKGSK